MATELAERVSRVLRDGPAKVEEIVERLAADGAPVHESAVRAALLELLNQNRATKCGALWVASVPVECPYDTWQSAA